MRQKRDIIWILDVVEGEFHLFIIKGDVFAVRGGFVFAVRGDF